MQKVNIFIFIVIILGAVFGYSYLNGEEQKIEAHTIVALGDSLTYGLGSTKGNDYVSKLEKKLGKEIINMGVMGDTTADVLARLDAVIEKDPDVVILFIGGNDILRKVDEGVMFGNIETIISRLKQSGAHVVLVGMPGGIITDPFDTKFEDISFKYHTTYVPEFMGALIRGRENMYDGIHPNDVGYEIVAEKIFEGIKDVIK